MQPAAPGLPETPRAAATVVLLRDSTAGPEVLLLRRNAQASNMAGVYVFPGGKLDADDATLDADTHLDQPHATLHANLNEPDTHSATAAGLYVAALREALEECGLLLAEPVGGTSAVNATRARAMLLAAAAARLSSWASRPLMTSNLAVGSDGWAIMVTVGPLPWGRLTPGTAPLPCTSTTALPVGGSCPTDAEKNAPRKPANAPNHDESVPAASNCAASGCVANTMGSFSARESRRSKKGSGRKARLLSNGSGLTISSSMLSLPTLAHRLECAGSSHSMV